MARLALITIILAGALGCEFNTYEADSDEKASAWTGDILGQKYLVTPPAELRTLEALRDGQPSTPYLKHGDTVRIEMIDDDGASIFGAIEQVVQPFP